MRKDRDCSPSQEVRHEWEVGLGENGIVHGVPIVVLEEALIVVILQSWGVSHGANHVFFSNHGSAAEWSWVDKAPVSSHVGHAWFQAEFGTGLESFTIWSTLLVVLLLVEDQVCWNIRPISHLSLEVAEQSVLVLNHVNSFNEGHSNWSFKHLYFVLLLKKL